MAENVVFTGEGRPEVVKPRLVDKVLDRVKNRLKQNTGEIVEKKYMDAYQKIVDALDEGQRKKVMQKLRPVAKLGSKIFRGVSKASDLVLQLGGMIDVGYGFTGVTHPEERIQYAKDFKQNVDKNFFQLLYQLPASYVSQQYAFAKYTPKEAQVASAKEMGRGVIEFAFGTARISRIAAGWLADIAGAGGEKVAQITNKILRGKPKAGPVAG